MRASHGGHCTALLDPNPCGVGGGSGGGVGGLGGGGGRKFLYLLGGIFDYLV